MVRTTTSIAFFFLFLTLVSCTNGTMGGSSATNADINTGNGSNSNGGASGANNQNRNASRRFVVGEPFNLKDSNGDLIKAELSATGPNGDWYFVFTVAGAVTPTQYLGLIKMGDTSISEKYDLTSVLNDYSVEEIQISASGKIYLLAKKYITGFYALSFLILSHDFKSILKNGTQPVGGQYLYAGTEPPTIFNHSTAQAPSGGSSENVTFAARIATEIKLVQLSFNGTNVTLSTTVLTNATDLHSLEPRDDDKLIALIAPSPSPAASPTPLAARMYEIDPLTDSNLGDFEIFPSALSYKWGSFINTSFFGVSPFGGGLSVFRYSFDGVNTTLTSEDSFRITPDTITAFYGAIPNDRAKEAFYLYRTSEGLIASATVGPDRQIKNINLSLNTALTGFTEMDPVFEGAYTVKFNAKGKIFVILTNGVTNNLIVPLRIEDSP